MIVELLFLIVQGVVSMIGQLVEFPVIPEEIESVIDYVFFYLQSGLSFVWLIVPRDIVVLLLPVVVVLINFEYIYKMFMWVVRKIPMLGIQ